VGDDRRAEIKQTVRKLQDLSIKWRKERAGRNFSRFRPVGRLMRPEGLRNARIRADEPTALSRDGGGHRLDAEDVESAAQIVGERR
jgi:hypothetical protein